MSNLMEWSNMSMTYLVTGATGTVGSLVVERLVELGHRPRIFVRDAKKARARYGDRVDVFVGDLADTSTMQAALSGSDAMLLINAGSQLATLDERAAQAANSAGVKHLVKLSSYDATVPNTGTGIWHAQAEAAIRAIGMPFTFVQPSGFMSNALFWANPIKSQGVLQSCTGYGKIPFIHPQDIADVATKALTSPPKGDSLLITGPEALSYAEMLARISEAIGKPLKYEVISENEERRRMIDFGDPEEIIAAHLSIYRAIQEGRLVKPTDTVERFLGRKPFTFEEWIQQNLAAFAQPVEVL
jgi:uncharacterized protein YbjT (DUF2867 family)